jgi:hypothetical protein
MARNRGFLEAYNPKPETVMLISEVNKILIDEAEYLPLTLRQIFYRLVVKELIDKTEKSYKRMCETVGTARRGKMIGMDDIRDDGFRQNDSKGWESIDSMMDTFRYTAETFTLDRQDGQAQRIIVWCEAGGMIPQLQRVANDYSIPVYSSGGFDSITTQHSMGKLFSKNVTNTLVLHIGDHDPSGVHMFSALEENVMSFAKHYGGFPKFVRLAVTPAQVSEYNLPTQPPKKTDNRRFEGNETTQAEALPPATMANVLRDAIESKMDMEIYNNIKDQEIVCRDELVDKLAGL